MKKDIPNKNYIYLAVICIITVLIALFIVKWVKDYEKEKMSVSPLDGVVQSISSDEIGEVTSEMNDVLLYIGYAGNKRMYISEERILKYLKRHDFKDKLIYVDVKSHLDNKEYVSIIKNMLNIDEETNIEAPSLIYIKNNEVKKIITNQSGYIYTDDINKLNLEFNLEDK